MRDVLLVLVVLASIPYIVRRPHIGVLMWVWISVMNPHRLTWGFTYDFNFAAVVGAVTLVSVIFSRDVKVPPMNGLTLALLLFVGWTGVTTVFAFYPAEAYEKWSTMMKTQLMAFLIPMLFHRKEHFRQLIWVIVLSIAYYGTKGGLWVLLTGGGERVFGPAGSYIEDNNALAVAVIMTIPLMRYLQITSAHKYVRWSLSLMMLLCTISAIGSYSRGALLAIVAMVAVLWWKSRRKLAMLLVALAVFPFMLTHMPEKWYTRMDTIATYEQDSSANMRLNAWGTMFNLAKDRPLVGGGFEVDMKDVFEKYAPDPGFPPQVAHSIYFQALGEHGFVGLALYLMVYCLFWRQAVRLVRDTRKHPHLAWAEQFGLMIQVSLVGFAVGGAFLSLVNYDVPYYLMGATIVARSLVGRELRGNSAGRMRGSAPDVSSEADLGIYRPDADSVDETAARLAIRPAAPGAAAAKPAH